MLSHKLVNLMIQCMHGYNNTYSNQWCIRIWPFKLKKTVDLFSNCTGWQLSGRALTEVVIMKTQFSLTFFNPWIYVWLAWWDNALTQ